MSEAATFLLDNDSEQDRRRGEPFSVLHPTRLLHYAQIVHAARQAGPGDRWIALHANLAATALRAAVETNKRLGLMLVLAPVKIETATALFSCFRYVVISPRPGSLLPFDELADVLVADNKDGLFLGGSVDQNSETVTLWRGNGKPLVVPMSSFPPSGDGKKPDFDRFSVSDYGHTLRFGEYESSADVVLYEHDAEFRAKLNETRRAEEQGFGPALRRLRIQRGLRQSDFEPVPAKTIARIERGEVSEPRDATLEAIAGKLGVQPEEIGTY